MSILIIEDNHFMALTMKTHLEALGYPGVLTADSAERALALLETESFDLLLVDWVLPNMSGLELVRQVRKRERHADVSIIMCTGQGKMEDLLEAVESGADDYIVKPARRETLQEKVVKAVGPPRKKSQSFAISTIKK